jgi:rhodanese-related sulfurtransferase
MKRSDDMGRLTLLGAVMMVLMLPGAVKGFDRGVAATCSQIFSEVRGAAAGKGLRLVSPEAFVKDLDRFRRALILDVRTPEETAIIGMSLGKVRRVPASELFRGRTLEALPTEGDILVVCSSGARAVAVGTALRIVGFRNVSVLQGGLAQLSAYLNSPAPLGKP